MDEPNAVPKANWRAMWAIVHKDLTLEFRGHVMLGAMAGYSLMVLLLFGLSVPLSSEARAAAIPGILWVTFAFSGMLGLGRSFILERDQACLDGLLLAPCDLSALLFGKIVGNLLFMAITEVLTLLLAVVLFDLRLHMVLLPVLFLGTLGLATVGTLFSALSAQVRARELLLPVLVLPLCVPVLVAATRLTAALLDRGSWAGEAHWLHLLVAFDVIYLAVSYMSFDAVMEA